MRRATVSDVYAYLGSEANETAIKIARMFHALRGESLRRTVLSLADGYHGSTLATAAMSQLPAARSGNEPLPQSFAQVAAPRWGPRGAQVTREGCPVPGPEASRKL